MKRVNIWERLRGVVYVELYAAFPESILNACAQRGLVLRDLERVDSCTLRLTVREGDLDELRTLCQRRQAELKELDRRGGSRDRRRMRRRVTLPLSLLLAGALLLWSNSRVWQIEVRGCERLTTGQVLRALSDCGLTEGSRWPGLSQDSIRDEMLLALPELGWMTVNVSGSRAVVTVVERTEKPEIYREDDAADIRAKRTGIVSSLRVLNGRPLVTPGSAVTEGELLVTGAMDSLSHPTRYVHAEAEVLADTWYEQTAVCAPGQQKGEVQRVIRRFALQFGKKRINFFRWSRKELDGYDKIVHEYRVGVQGLFALPLTLIREDCIAREHLERTEADAAACAERLREELAGRIDGEILQFRPTASLRDGLSWVSVRAHCRENIAETVSTLSSEAGERP